MLLPEHLNQNPVENTYGRQNLSVTLGKLDICISKIQLYSNLQPLTMGTWDRQDCARLREVASAKAGIAECGVRNGKS